MKSLRFAMPAIFVAAALVAAACGGSGSSSSSAPPTSASGTGQAVFAVKDAAANMGSVTSVQVTIDSVRAHAQGGAWTTVSTQTQTFDLLKLRANNSVQLLAQANLDAGFYDQVDLNVSKTVVVDAQGQHDAKLPSNKLQLKGLVTVKQGSTATATFDFIADESLHVTGNGEYIMAPVIQFDAKSDAQATVKSDKTVEIFGKDT